MNAAAFTVRPWQPGDSLAALTGLLHRAYAPLAAAGLNFTAATQTEAVTAQRLRGAHTWVAVEAVGGTLVGTITAAGPFDPNTQGWAHALPWFYRDDTAHFHQYAVEPAWQGQGIGAALLAAAEGWALAAGHRALLLDTAEPAAALRARYARAGFDHIGRVQWQGKAYRSVVMCKALVQPAPTDTDAAHHAATVRALWASFQARDWPAARALLADGATLCWRASGEHLLDADAIIRVQTLFPDTWQLHLDEATPLADGRVHSRVQVLDGGQCFIAHSLFRFSGALIDQIDETWATWETAPAWRTADAIGAYRRDARFPLPPTGPGAA